MYSRNRETALARLGYYFEFVTLTGHDILYILNCLLVVVVVRKTF